MWYVNTVGPNNPEPGDYWLWERAGRFTRLCHALLGGRVRWFDSACRHLVEKLNHDYSTTIIEPAPKPKPERWVVTCVGALQLMEYHKKIAHLLTQGYEITGTEFNMTTARYTTTLQRKERI